MCTLEQLTMNEDTHFKKDQATRDKADDNERRINLPEVIIHPRRIEVSFPVHTGLISQLTVGFLKWWTQPKN